jgi:thiamine pyrophosphate-dependent acetolactate synthase large subunit-like protein
MNLSYFIADYLEKKKIKDIFLVTGGGMMFLTDALSKSKINLIFNHQLLMHKFMAIARKLTTCKIRNLG